jgi:hypothetical protein
LLESLADAPGAALLLHLVLQVAARHVQTHGIAVDVLQRIGCLDVLAGLADGDDQLDLVVQILGQRGIGHLVVLPASSHGRVRRLHEEERRLAAGKAHFLGVILIVAAHAVDAVNGKALATAHNRQAGNGRGGNT